MVERLAAVDDDDVVEPAAQSARSAWFIPHGLLWFSIERYAFPSSVGKFDSMSDR